MPNPRLDKILREHDPEWDLPQGQPPVTWAEYYLAEQLQAAIDRIDALEMRISRLTETVRDYVPL